MARSSVCRVVQVSCPLWWPQQLQCSRNGSGRQCSWAQNTSLSRNSGLLAAREAVRGGPLLCCTRLCVGATFAHGNLVLRAAPQTQEVAWASGPPPEHRTADCVPAA